MKNIIYMSWLLIAFAYLFTACSPKEFDDYSAGSTPTEADIDFVSKPTAENVNVIEFTNSSPRTGIAFWDFGNGSKGKGDAVKGEYPFAGVFDVTLTLVTNGGTITKTKQVTIAEDDLALLDHPLYTFLTGGTESINGKTWVFDQYHRGHVGIGPVESFAPDWWAAGPNDKLECSLYDQEYTFKQVGVEMTWVNKGKVYTNGAGKDKLEADGYGPSSVPAAGDFDVEYTPKDKYTFTLNTKDSTLTISDGGFLGFYAGTSVLEILELNDDYMTLRTVSAVESGNAWYARFVVKEKNIEPALPPVENKAIPLFEDFEDENATIVFESEDMGELTSSSYANPAPVPNNESSKVFLYQKKAGVPYSNISHVVSGYKFDLTTQNKVRMKVYIPSYNDYTTEHEVAGDWITNKVLQKSIAVKLQDNDKGGDAWTTQVEKTYSNLETDKWLSLEFDFSDAANREDFDKIVIQFGTEGHNGGGIFFFDDFSFEE